ncbi:MAG: hypothetical protein KAT88_09340, partial [Spirochaetes bacterium]|nr:hypothetical protein [Spirochaetota bacterium]
MKKSLLFFLLFTGALVASCATDRPVATVKESARGYEKLALEHYNKGDFQGAILFFKKALSEDQKVNNLRGISSDLHNIARCYLNFDLLSNAEKILGEAIEINTHINN